ncbi:MAG: enoyl-CoA hydratase/isomerase family protein [Planctomycetota bacterium]
MDGPQAEEHAVASDTPEATLGFDGPVATLTLQRPAQRNALSTGLLADLHSRLDELDAIVSPPTVLVITGAGRSFCAGMDLQQVIIDQDTAADVPLRLLESLARATHRIRMLPCVSIAKVNGAAIGGGCGLVTICDLAITHADAKLGFPEVDLGLCPAVVTPWLVKRIGAGPARRVLLRGGIMSGQAAAEIGIVTDLVETREQLDERCDSMARSLTAGGPKALRATKELLNELDGSASLEVLLRAAKLSAQVLSTDDAQARLRGRRG